MQCFGLLRAKRPRQLYVLSCPDPAIEKDRRLVFKVYETFFVCFSEEVATFSGEDGTQLDVPLRVLNRSDHLRVALTDVIEGNVQETCITLPGGVLQRWLGSLHDLGIIRKEAVLATPCEREGLIEQNVRYLKAADFLYDPECLQQLVSRAVTLLFPPSDGQNCHIGRREAMMDLPPGLLSHILTACHRPFLTHLNVLPALLHMASLYASFPDMSTSASLTVENIRSQRQVDCLAPLLGQLNSLKNLTVSGNPLKRRCHGGALLLQAQGHVELQKLSFRHLLLSPMGVDALGQHLRWLSALQELHIECRISDIDSIRAFLAHISCLKGLRVLSLREVHLKEVGAKLLSRGIRKLSGLRKLCLANTLLATPGVKALTSVLPSLKLLEHLDLSENDLGNSDKVLTQTLPRLTSLRNLELQAVSWEPSKSLWQFHYKMRQLTALESLNFSESIGTRNMFHSIGSMLSLRTLMLSECRAMSSSDHQVHLLANLSRLTVLEKLDLGQNWLNSIYNVPLQLASCISELKQLTWLSVSYIGHKRFLQGLLPNTAGLAAGLRGLQSTQKLKYLDISGNEYTPDEAQGIARALCAFTSLRCLRIGNTNLLRHALDIFSQGENLWCLEELELQGTWGSEDRESEIFSNIGHMSSLRSFNLSNNDILMGGVSSLLDILPRLSCLTFLGMRNCSFNADVLLLLCYELDKLNAIQRLELSENGMNSDVWEALAPARNRGVDIDTF